MGFTAEWAFVLLGWGLAVLILVRPDVLKEINVALSPTSVQQEFWRNISPTSVRVLGAFAFVVLCIIAFQIGSPPSKPLVNKELSPPSQYGNKP